jgi:hypothetical protein
MKILKSFWANIFIEVLQFECMFTLVMDFNRNDIDFTCNYLTFTFMPSGVTDYIRRLLYLSRLGTKGV